MIIEERIYTLQHGCVPRYLSLYEKHGRALQLAHLGCNLGYYSSDVGPQNQIVHLWAYADHADREARRTQLRKDPAWQSYLELVRELMLTQETKILIPAPFMTEWVAQQLKLCKPG
jgi:NIPSNAP